VEPIVIAKLKQSHDKKEKNFRKAKLLEEKVLKEKKGRHWIKSWKGRLGPLQTEIMHLIFRYGKKGISAGDIFTIMYEKQRLPRSSVYTVLNRLIKRGLLERRKVEGVYHYYALIQEKDLGKFGSFEDKIHTQGVTDLISRLLRREVSYNPEEIEKLEKLLAQEKKRLKNKQRVRKTLNGHYCSFFGGN